MAQREIEMILRKYLRQSEINGIIRSEEAHPSEILGPRVTPDGILVQVYEPQAISIRLRTLPDILYYDMIQVDEGYFAALIPGKRIPSYTLLVSGENSQSWEMYDAYAFDSCMDEKDEKRFREGSCYEIYQVLGAHPTSRKGIPGTQFAVWAPNAKRVSVVGDFNHWDGRVCQMNRRESGIFELFVPGVMRGDLYKYEIKTQSGLTYLKADPYANQGQLRPNNASVVWDLNRYYWSDDIWVRSRAEKQKKDAPCSIYEMHMGTFRRPNDGRLFYNYRELAPMVASYVREMGYTHVEFMPLMEYPLDESFGYETTGYYAPTARYGTPDDFRYFVDYMHREGIGIILDWTPTQFPKDEFSLASFDGTPLYENPDPVQATHAHWGTLTYDYKKPQVRNFLLGSAIFWAREYHIDGLRLDASAMMLYLDYRRKEGQWTPNIYGGNENLEAIDFLKQLNQVLHKIVPGFITIAGDSAKWPGVTIPFDQEGLGFDYVWNTEWTYDLLHFMSKDEAGRKENYDALTMSTVYGFYENYLLGISHDQVIKKQESLINRMPGDSKEKFANLRLLYSYQLVHPGKILMFMGQELADSRHWNTDGSMDWELMTKPEHAALRDCVIALNTLYRSQPALYRLDSSADGFEWINALDREHCLLAFLRKTKEEEETLLVLCNFSNRQLEDFRVGVPYKGKYKEVFNSDAAAFGGSGLVNPRSKYSEEKEADERSNSICISLAPLSLAVFACQPSQKKGEEGAGSKDKAAVREKKSGILPADFLQTANQIKDDAIRAANQMKDDTIKTASQMAANAVETIRLQGNKVLNSISESIPAVGGQDKAEKTEKEEKVEKTAPENP